MKTSTPSVKQLLISPFQSDLLDLARWAAAFLVVAEHARSLIFRPYAAEPTVGVFAKVFYFMTGFGHSAVMVFFVMSGFLVGGKILERLALGTFSWQKYMVDRSSRLYAVYLLALILGGALDYCGYQFLNRYGLYDQSCPDTIAVVNQDFSASVTPTVFGINLVMCQTVLGPVFGSNGPLWSLANEFWYYLAGPLLFALLHTLKQRASILRAVALAAIFWFLPGNILIYFGVWVFGALLYFVNTRPMLPPWLSWLFFLASFGAARLQLIKLAYLGDILIAIGFALVINSACLGWRRLPWNLFSRRAADFSYSVYLCHFPFLIFTLSAIHQVTGNGIQEPLSGWFFTLFLVVLMLAYGWCYVVSLITERQTPRIRAWMHRVLSRDRLAQTGTVL